MTWDVGAVLANWIDRFDRHPIRLHRRTSAPALSAPAAQLVESLCLAATAGPVALAPGRPEVRELERACAFLGGHMSAIGAGGFDVAAAVLSVRDAALAVGEPAVATAVTRLFEWLLIVAMEAYSAGGLESLRDQVRDLLEQTPAVQILDDLPAVFWVGEPDVQVAQNVLERVLMLAIAGNAPAMMIDASHARDPGGNAMTYALAAFFEKKRVQQVAVLTVGLSGSARDRWHELASRSSVRAFHFDRTQDAVRYAREQLGCGGRRPTQ